MDELIETVVETIKVDFTLGDYTSLETLLENVPTKHLLAYLPEDIGKDLIERNPCLTKL